MDSAQADLNALVARLRNEIRRRKLALEQRACAPVDPDLEIAAPAEGPAPGEGSIPARAPVRSKQQLNRARSAVDRALKKNSAAKSWPRFLRGLRRNQGAINESALQAFQALLDACDGIEQRIRENVVRIEDAGRRLTQLEERVSTLVREAGEQQAKSAQHESHLRDLERKLIQRARQGTEQEERIEQQRRQIEELRDNAGLSDNRSTYQPKRAAHSV